MTQKQVDLKRKLTNVDIETLVGTSDSYDKFCAPQSFQGYEMHFLKKRIEYEFTEVVGLTKSRYNYKILKMNKTDVDAINALFKRLNRKLKIGEGEQYVNGKNVKFICDEVSFHFNFIIKKLLFLQWFDVDVDFQENKMWKISITLQGYKVGKGEHMSPIWMLKEARKKIMIDGEY